MSLLEELINGPSAADQYLSMASMFGPARSSGSPGPGVPQGASPAGRPAQWINEALQATGAPRSWADELYDLMMRESGGDPRAYNDTPVASGQHAQGLFQTIPTTFRANREQGLGGIYNPVANAAAAINYIMGRYGSPMNLPESGGY